MITADDKGVYIPGWLWSAKELSIVERVIVAEVYSFEANGRACWVSNQHLADLVGLSSNSVRRILAKLEAENWLERVEVPTGRTGRQLRLGGGAHRRGGGCSSVRGGVLTGEGGGAHGRAPTYTKTYTKTSTNTINGKSEFLNDEKSTRRAPNDRPRGRDIGPDDFAELVAKYRP